MGARLHSWWQYIRKHRRVAIMIAIVRAAMVLIFIEGLINGTGFNGYYTPSTTAPAADHHQPSQELKYTNRQNALGLGATASIPTVLALAG